jgi:hypothetical protein
MQNAEWTAGGSRGRKCLSPEFPGGFTAEHAESAEDGADWGKATANGTAFNAEDAEACPERSRGVAEKDGNRVTAEGERPRKSAEDADGRRKRRRRGKGEECVDLY